MVVVTVLPDGRVIARATITTADRLDAGPLATTATLSDLKEVEYVIQVNIDTDPQTNATPQNISISDNVVGLTVYVAAGTTISGEVFAIGF